MRRVNDRTRLAVDLGEPLAIIESLTSRLELTDADLGALSNSLVGPEGDVGALSRDVSALSNNHVGLKEDVSVLSNTLVHDYIPTRGLNAKLMATYKHQFEKLNFTVVDLKISGVAKIGGQSILDPIDETSDQYVMPNDITL